MPPKKNAYSVFVEKRCKETKCRYADGFTRFGDEWTALSNAEKQKFADVAANFNKGRDVLEAMVPKKKTDTETPRVLIPEVPHGYNEVVIKEDENDVYAPETSTFLEGDFKLVRTAYPSLEVARTRKVVVVGCIPVADCVKNSREINRPIELSVGTFDLALGYNMNSFDHWFIYPDTLPKGSFWAVNDARRNTHRIPAASHIRTDDTDKLFNEEFRLEMNYYEIYIQLLRLTTLGEKDSEGKRVRLPVLTTWASEDIGTTWACLKWLQNKAVAFGEKHGYPDALDLPEISVATLETFCIQMFRFHNRLNALEEGERAQKTYENSAYRFNSSLKCNFHKMVEATACAQNMVNSRIYSTFDILRISLALPKSGRFVPVDD